MTERSSYDLKIDRAEKHLIELESLISDWVDTHPYEVRVGDQGKRQSQNYRLHFTSNPPDAIGVVAGDFLYDVHSSLNHIAAALVIPSRRTKTMFPILWQGVWEDGPDGENEQRVKDRAKWRSFTKTMAEGAVAIIKINQPPDLGANEKSTSGLAVINRLRNADAHSKLPVVAGGLLRPHGTYETREGETRRWHAPDFGDRDSVDNGAPVTGIPDGAVNVKIEGTPVVLVDIGLKHGGVLIPDAFREIALDGTRRAIAGLRPFVRTP